MQAAALDRVNAGAWLLLLPLAALAWPGPGALLELDPFGHLAGTGILALGALPLGLLLLTSRTARTRLPGLRALAILCAFQWITYFAGGPTDGFEARRACVQLSTTLVLFVSGARLDARARGLYLQGLVVLSILWTGTALWWEIAGKSGALAGVLGNTGTLSQAALAGAAIGSWHVVSANGLRRSCGLVALGLFLIHAGLAPVFAGALALLLALTAGWAPHGMRRARGLGVLAALTIVSMFGLRLATSWTDQANAGSHQASEHSSQLGGVGVRSRIWMALPRLVREQPLFGLGPGQFQAGFPPYRDPLEIEASRGGVLSTLDTEVEHAHNDILQMFAEGGLVAGCLWLLFLALATRAALRSLRSSESTVIAAGLSGLAILANALFHSPLTYNPAAAAIGAVLFGCVLGQNEGEPGSTGLRLSPWTLRLVGMVAIAGGAFGYPLVTHGRILVSHAQATLRVLRSQESGAQASGQDELSAALAELELAARQAQEYGHSSAPLRSIVARSAGTDERLAAWESVLELRPHNVEALSGIGLHHAQAGHIEAARTAWQRALELSPTQPRLLENLARLELFEGDFARGSQYVEQLIAQGSLQGAAGIRFGEELVLRGFWREGAPLLTGSPFGALSPERLNADAHALKERGEDARADALRCLAHLAWGRGHIEREDYDSAVRSYRQVLRTTRRVERPDRAGAATIVLELAAAEALAGRPDAARATCAGLVVRDSVRALLPAWVRQELGGTGLLP